MQQQRVAQGGSIAVAGGHRVGEPHQIVAAASRRLDPLTIVPPQGRVAQRIVVLAGAGRPGGAMDRNVQLIEGVQLCGQRPGEQTRQTWGHAGSDDERCVVLHGQRLQRQHGHQVVDVVADGDHRCTAGEQPLSECCVRCGLAQHHHVAHAEVVGVVDDHHTLAAHTQPRSRVVHGNRNPARHEVGDRTAAGDAATHQTDDGGGGWAHLGGTLTSRQPPSCGGTPPLPRNRSTPAIVPANDSATSARRSIFMGGAYQGRCHHCARRQRSRGPP